MGRTLIIGAGLSALGAARLLKKLGQPVLVSDIAIKYSESFEMLKAEGIETIVGPQTEDLLRDVSELIVSPGLPPHIPLLEAARRLSLPIRSEIDLALDHFRGRIIGVTGTNGKSTTTTLTSHLLQGLGYDAVASGNIGLPPSQVLADGHTPDPFVLELSSYQLDFSQSIANRASVFTSFSEDHLERHKTLEQYFSAKWKLVLATDEDGLCIMPRAIVEAARSYSSPRPKAELVQIVVDGEKPLAWAPGPTVHLDSKKGLVTGDGIKGKRQVPPGMSFHNQFNLLSSILAIQALRKTSWDECLAHVHSYPWLAFRFEKIGSIQGQPVYNDSKSTNVESTLMALRSVSEPAILFLGGQPKGESFAAITGSAKRIRCLIGFGAAGDRIGSELSELEPIIFSSLREALDALPDIIRDHRAPLVFSPACSSFDEFKNFEDRGSYFSQRLGPYLD